MNEWSVTTASAEETQALGRLLGELLPSRALLFLMGDLGAGKTCFVQGLARGVGVPEDEPITSPTFTLMNQYTGRSPLYHFDLYRLSGLDDLLDLGFEEYLHGEGVSVVEWAERAQGLGDEALNLYFSQTSEQGRQIVFRGNVRWAGDLLPRLAALWQERGKR